MPREIIPDTNAYTDLYLEYFVKYRDKNSTEDRYLALIGWEEN